MILLYLTAIIIANLSIGWFGQDIVIINAFLFIGLDLTTRDHLHERWQGQNLWRNMLLLVGTGSILSAMFNYQVSKIAFASFCAFMLAGVADTIIYQYLIDAERIIKINGSNVVSAAVDSIVFPALAFGLPLQWHIIAGMFIAKTIGGFIWSVVLNVGIQPILEK